MKSLKSRLDETKDDTAHKLHQGEALERMRSILIEINKERPVGRGGGAKRWPVHIFFFDLGALIEWYASVGGAWQHSNDVCGVHGCQSN